MSFARSESFNPPSLRKYGCGRCEVENCHCFSHFTVSSEGEGESGRSRGSDGFGTLLSASRLISRVPKDVNDSSQVGTTLSRRDPHGHPAKETRTDHREPTLHSWSLVEAIEDVLLESLR